MLSACWRHWMGVSPSSSTGDPSTEVELKLDYQTASNLVGLFDILGQWLSDGSLAACQIGLGDRTYTLLAATADKPSDPTTFLLARTIQLQTALDSRIVIEQAKGVVAERDSITPDEAFQSMRREARNRRMKLHELAAGIVESVSKSADEARH
jgi:hypothetical protein